MGIPPTPPQYDVDHFCFLPGQTPHRMLMTISGVHITEYWHEGYGPCENGTTILTRVTETVWEWRVSTDYTKWVNFEHDATWILANNCNGISVFSNVAWESCAFAMDDYEDPTWPFQGGHVILTPYGSPSDIHSLESASLIAGVEFIKGVFAHPIAGKNGIACHRFARQSDHTCITLKKNA